MRQYVLLACLSPVACLMAATGQKGGKAKQKINDRQLPNVVFIYAAPFGSPAPTNEAKEANQSICETKALETCDEAAPFGHLTMAGIRVPPSKALYLLPRNGPAGL